MGLKILLTLAGNGKIECSGDSEFSIRSRENGNVLFSGNSMAKIEGESIFRIEEGNLISNGHSQIIIDDHSSFYVDDSFIGNQNVSVIVQNQSLLSVGGNLSFSGALISIVNDSLLQINGTNLHNTFFQLDNQSNMTIEQSSLVISAASFFSSSFSSLSSHNSEIKLMTESIVSFRDYSSASFHNTSLILFSDFSFEQFSRLNGNFSSIEIQSGTLFLSNDSLFSLSHSRLDILEGSFILSGNSELHSMSNHIIIEKNLIAMNETREYIHSSEIEILSGGNLILQNDCEFSMFFTSLDILEGFLLSFGDSFLSISDSALLIHSGNVEWHDSSFFQSYRSELNLLDSGSILNNDFSKTSLASSSILHVSGSFIASGSAQFQLLGNSQLFIENSSSSSRSIPEESSQESRPAASNFLLRENSSFFADSSEIGINDFGRFSISENASLLLINQSNFTIISSGFLELQHSSNFTVSGSSLLQIDGGSLILRDEATFNLVHSEVQLASGDCFIEQNAKIRMENGSLFEINGGKLKMKEEGELVIEKESSFRIVNGDLEISNHAAIIINENSSFTIVNGSLKTTRENSIFVSGNSSFLNGKEMQLAGNVVLPPGNSFVVSRSGFLNVFEPVEFFGDFESFSAKKSTKHSQIASRFFADEANQQKEGRLASLSSLDNLGEIRMCPESLGNEKSTFHVPFNNMGGFLQFCASEIQMKRRLISQNGGKMEFHASNIEMEGNEAIQNENESEAAGFLALKGNFINSAKILQSLNNGTLFHINGSFVNTELGSLDLIIDDPSLPGPGFSQINVLGEMQLAGQINICLRDHLAKKKSKINLLTFGSLVGRFDHVSFDCNENHQSSSSYSASHSYYSSSSESSSSGGSSNSKGFCSPKAEYTARSFTILLGHCDDETSWNSTFLWLMIAFLIASFIIILFVITLYQFKPVKRIVVGRETARIIELRKHSKTLST